MKEWTPEEISELSTEKVKALRENAAKRGQQHIAERCDNVLAQRLPERKKNPRQKTIATSNRGRDITEYHLVCKGELGVTRNPDKTVWTGTWVINKSNAIRAVEIGAHVALHASKAEHSYLQGKVISWRESERQRSYAEDRPARVRTGIDFLVAPTNEPMAWRGDGAGEKGYAYAPDESGSQ